MHKKTRNRRMVILVTLIILFLSILGMAIYLVADLVNRYQASSNEGVPVKAIVVPDKREHIEPSISQKDSTSMILTVYSESH